MFCYFSTEKFSSAIYFQSIPLDNKCNFQDILPKNFNAIPKERRSPFLIKYSGIKTESNSHSKLKTSGDIEVKNNNNTITLKANGDIELGASTLKLKTLVHSAFLTLYNAHTHPYPVGQTTLYTGIPLEPAVEALQCTLNVKGQ